MLWVFCEEQLNKTNATLEYPGNPFATLHNRPAFQIHQHELPQTTANWNPLRQYQQLNYNHTIALPELIFENVSLSLFTMV